MKLYTDAGWLDVEHVNEVADRNNINFIIIIGKRQIGKTYGVLKFMLDSAKNFIFMRRVKPEIEMLEKGVNSPFDKIKEFWLILPFEIANFKDISSEHWAYKAISKCVEKRLLLGYPDNTFAPNKSLTRAELAVILYRMMKGE